MHICTHAYADRQVQIFTHVYDYTYALAATLQHDQHDDRKSEHCGADGGGGQEVLQNCHIKLNLNFEKEGTYLDMLYLSK